LLVFFKVIDLKKLLSKEILKELAQSHLDIPHFCKTRNATKKASQKWNSETKWQMIHYVHEVGGD